MDLITQNLGLAHWAVQRYGAGLDYDDAVGICYVRLCELALRYNPERGAFATYAIVRMRGALLDERRRQVGRYTRRPYTQSLDALKEDINFDLPNHHLPEPRESWGLWREIKYLDPREQDIIYLRIVKDMTHASIARHQNLSEARIGQIYRRALKKLSARLAAQGGSVADTLGMEITWR